MYKKFLALLVACMPFAQQIGAYESLESYLKTKGGAKSHYVWLEKNKDVSISEDQRPQFVSDIFEVMMRSGSGKIDPVFQGDKAQEAKENTLLWLNKLTRGFEKPDLLNAFNMALKKAEKGDKPWQKNLANKEYLDKRKNHVLIWLAAMLVHEKDYYVVNKKDKTPRLSFRKTLEPFKDKVEAGYIKDVISGIFDNTMNEAFDKTNPLDILSKDKFFKAGVLKVLQDKRNQLYEDAKKAFDSLSDKTPFQDQFGKIEKVDLLKNWDKKKLLFKQIIETYEKEKPKEEPKEQPKKKAKKKPKPEVKEIKEEPEVEPKKEEKPNDKHQEAPGDKPQEGLEDKPEVQINFDDIKVDPAKRPQIIRKPRSPKQYGKPKNYRELLKKDEENDQEKGQEKAQEEEKLEQERIAEKKKLHEGMSEKVSASANRIGLALLTYPEFMQTGAWNLEDLSECINGVASAYPDDADDDKEQKKKEAKKKQFRSMIDVVFLYIIKDKGAKEKHKKNQLEINQHDIEKDKEHEKYIEEIELLDNYFKDRATVNQSIAQKTIKEFDGTKEWFAGDPAKVTEFINGLKPWDETALKKWREIIDDVFSKKNYEIFQTLNMNQEDQNKIKSLNDRIDTLKLYFDKKDQEEN